MEISTGMSYILLGMLRICCAVVFLSSCTLPSSFEVLSFENSNSLVVSLSTSYTSPVHAPIISYSVSFSVAPQDFGLGDISVTNGTAQNLSGTGTNYAFEVVPTANGAVSVKINAGELNGAAGQVNLESNTLTLIYLKPLWSQEAYLKAANAEAGDAFGFCVGIDGDTVVVGAYSEASNQTIITNGDTASSDNSLSGAGAVYVYRRNGATWSQEAYIKAANTDTGDNFGNRLGIDGDTLVVGARYEDSNQTTITNGSTASPDNSVSNAGAVYVYRRSGATWFQEAYIKAVNPGAGDQFGNRLAFSGDTIVVGAHLEDSNQTTITNGTSVLVDDSLTDSGAAYIFRRSGVNWFQEAYIKAANAGATDWFGYRVDISDDTVVIGASQEDSNQITITNGSTASSDDSAENSGAVYVYRRNGSDWSQEAYIKAVNSDAGDAFGTSVGVSGDTLVVGSNNEDSNQTLITNGATASSDNSIEGAGAVYVYRRNGATWSQEAYIKAANSGAGDGYGSTVSISGDTLVVGSKWEDSNQVTITNGTTASIDDTALDSGAVYVYRRMGVKWFQEAYIKAVNAEANDEFGVATGISGNSIIVGANKEDSNQTTITNGTTASSDNSTSSSGAAYVYVRSQ